MVDSETIVLYLQAFSIWFKSLVFGIHLFAFYALDQRLCACVNDMADVLSVQKVLSSSGRATRRWPMYFPIRRSFPARSEPDRTFWTASTLESHEWPLTVLSHLYDV